VNASAKRTTLDDVRIDHRCAHIGMFKQILL